MRIRCFMGERAATRAFAAAMLIAASSAGDSRDAGAMAGLDAEPDLVPVSIDRSDVRGLSTHPADFFGTSRAPTTATTRSETSTLIRSRRSCWSAGGRSGC